MVDDAFERFGLEGRAGCQQIVENRAQSIYIAVPAHLAALRTGLFRRHEVRRTEHLAGYGHTCVTIEPLGQSKVRDARLIARVHQDVRWLEIAMQVALLMRVVDGFSNELDVTRSFRGRQPTV